eukprot:753346-Hanusia_phi.AAC.1
MKTGRGGEGREGNLEARVEAILAGAVELNNDDPGVHVVDRLRLIAVGVKDCSFRVLVVALVQRDGCTRKKVEAEKLKLESTSWEPAEAAVAEDPLKDGRDADAGRRQIHQLLPSNADLNYRIEDLGDDGSTERQVDVLGAKNRGRLDSGLLPVHPEGVVACLVGDLPDFMQPLLHVAVVGEKEMKLVAVVVAQVAAVVELNRATEGERLREFDKRHVILDRVAKARMPGDEADVPVDDLRGVSVDHRDVGQVSSLVEAGGAR